MIAGLASKAATIGLMVAATIIMVIWTWAALFLRRWGNDLRWIWVQIRTTYRDTLANNGRFHSTQTETQRTTAYQQINKKPQICALSLEESSRY
eukprot:m.163562 g.163562  ORF g.163562 m.163562 type:complete len:94 (-) comp24918_c0_seq4:840-1121(-)